MTVHLDVRLRYIRSMSKTTQDCNLLELDTETIINLARQTLFRVPDRDADDVKKAEILIRKKKLEIVDINYLITFTFKYKNCSTQPKTIRSMLNEIFETIGSTTRKDSYTPTASRSDLEEIHAYIMSSKK